MTDAKRVLLVEDERAIRDAIEAYLEREGFWVTAVEDGAAALDAAGKHVFDLVVLDLMLPRIDGLEICRRLRSRSSVPIIMLTAKSEEIDKVVGLELGADDYIPKPFSPREVIARVKAIFRRSAPSPAVAADKVYEYGTLVMDLSRHEVRVGGELSALGNQTKVLGGKEIWGPLALADGKLVIRDQTQIKCVDLRAR